MPGPSSGCSRAAESSRVIDSDRTWAETIRVAQRAAELYRGPFLGGDGEPPWATALGDRIRRRLLRQLLWVGQSWEGKENLHEAARVYEEAVRVDPCAEDVCRSLMNVYRYLGRPADVVATYDHCRKALAGRLGTLPSAQTETLLERGEPVAHRTAIRGSEDYGTGKDDPA